MYCCDPPPAPTILVFSARTQAAFSSSRVLGFVLNAVKNPPRRGSYYYYYGGQETGGDAKQRREKRY